MLVMVLREPHNQDNNAVKPIQLLQPLQWTIIITNSITISTITTMDYNLVKLSQLALNSKVCDLRRRLNKLQSRTNEKRRWNENNQNKGFPKPNPSSKSTTKFDPHYYQTFRIKDTKKTSCSAYWTNFIFEGISPCLKVNFKMEEWLSGEWIQFLNSANIDTKLHTELWCSKDSYFVTIVFRGHSGIPVVRASYLFRKL